MRLPVLRFVVLANPSLASLALPLAWKPLLTTEASLKLRTLKNWRL